MKKVFVLLFAITMVIGLVTISGANETGPIALTDAQMDQIVAGKAHQSIASTLTGQEVAALMPEHVLRLGPGETPGKAHQSIAATLSGQEVAAIMPGHVRKNP